MKERKTVTERGHNCLQRRDGLKRVVVNLYNKDDFNFSFFEESD